jgi:Tol biopolymer transport system component
MDPVLSPDGKLLAYASDRAGNGNLDVWVQQVAGGGAVRLTRGEEDEDQPSFSSDGSKVAFRSLRGGGEIYVVPSLGGQEPRLLADQGRRPRYSPDGSQIAYSVGAATHAMSLENASRLYVIPASGGIPKQLEPAFTSAGFPIWLPDGKHLLFLGRRDATAPPEQTYDWWVASLDGSPAVKTGAYDRFRTAGFETSQIVPADIMGDQVLFAAPSGDSTNLWRIAIESGSWQVVEAPQRLTFGSSLETGPSFAQGKVVFASTVQKENLWSIAIEANQGKVLGNMERVTQGAATDRRPALSADGTKVAYLSGRPGNYDIWTKDLVTGRTSAITQSGLARDSVILSPDGSKVAYALTENGEAVCYIAPSGGGSPRKLPPDCSQVTDWSADGGKIAYLFGQPPRVGEWDEESGERSEPLAQSPNSMNRFVLSPDNRWATFRMTITSNHSRTFVAPVRPGGRPVPESEWILIHDGTGSDRPAAAWSPDGGLVYLLLDKDGFRCLWAQRLNEAKEPLGRPFPVLHSHGAAHAFISTGYGRSIAGGRFIFDQRETTGNIWTTTAGIPK